MPRGDRTGPQGMGPMTGRRMGHCAPGYAPYPPQHMGWGGRGWRHRFYATDVPGWAAPVSREDEVDWLQQQARGLQSALDQINTRLNDLEKDQS